MEAISRLDGIQTFQISARRLHSVHLRRRMGQYIVIGLIFVFFAIPIAGLSHYCYKFGVPARFHGLVQIFTH